MPMLETVTSRPPLTSMAALVVDDHIDTLHLLTQSLELYGAAVVGVCSAAEALARLDVFIPDIVLTDIRLVGDDGFQLLEKIRRQAHARLRDVPVIGMSGDAKYQHALQTLPFSAWMLKPVDPARLCAAILSVVGASRPSAAINPSHGTRADFSPMAHDIRVLVVDDDTDVAAMLGDLVQTFGHRTAIASNAAQAFRAVREFLPHVVLLDVTMPGIRGDTVLERLRTSTPSPPVIMVTGNRDEDEARRLLAAGACDYVSKPVDSTYLERAIAAAAATAGSA